MSVKQQLMDAQKEAMKAKDKETLSTIRMTLSAIKNEEINSGSELDDTGAQAVIAKQVKQLRDSAAEFEKGGRADLAEGAKKEMAILEVYLPAQMSDDELRAVVEAVVAEQGASAPSDMGKVMGPVMEKVQGQADGKRVKDMVQSLLQA